jgi:Xaa-Pro dipeptidase
MNNSSFLRSRRDFLQSSAVASALLIAPNSASASQSESSALPPTFASLKPLGSRVRPIAAEEFRERIEKAQKFMSEAQPKFDALFLAPGTGLYYFSGIRWWPSERLLALIIPRTGQDP